MVSLAVEGFLVLELTAGHGFLDSLEPFQSLPIDKISDI